MIKDKYFLLDIIAFDKIKEHIEECELFADESIKIEAFLFY